MRCEKRRCSPSGVAAPHGVEVRGPNRQTCTTTNVVGKGAQPPKVWQAPGAVLLYQNAGAYVEEVLYKFSRSYANVDDYAEYSFAGQVFLAVLLGLSHEHQSFPRCVLFPVGLEHKSISLRITPPCSVQVQDHFSEPSPTTHLSRTVATSGTLRLRIIGLSISSVAQRLSTEAALRSVRGNIGWRIFDDLSVPSGIHSTEQNACVFDPRLPRNAQNVTVVLTSSMVFPIPLEITTVAFAIQITLLRWSTVLARRASAFVPLGLKWFLRSMSPFSLVA